MYQRRKELRVLLVAVWCASRAALEIALPCPQSSRLLDGLRTLIPVSGSAGAIGFLCLALVDGDGPAGE